MILKKLNFKKIKFFKLLKILKKKMSKKKIPQDLLDQWHPTKNVGINPETLKVSSEQIVWWLCPVKNGCECVHEWSTKLYIRTTGNRTGCPFCAKTSKIFCFHKSLAFKFPELALQWHPTKNGDLTPEKITPGSEKKVWWFCPNVFECNCPHEWVTNLNNKISNIGTKCPFCNGTSGNNFCYHQSLEYLYPNLCLEWHPEKNGNLKPSDFKPGSSTKVWWLCNKSKCSCVHQWETCIFDRIRGSGCPYCAHQKYCVHESLLGKFPQITSKWHPTLNGNLKPENFSLHSNIVVWWKCENVTECGCEHVWKTKISHITSKNASSCPFCSVAPRVCCLHQSLLYKNPLLANEWCYEKNGNLRPESFTVKSGIKIWWKCLVNSEHTWVAIIRERNNNKGSGCPFCRCSTEKFLADYIQTIFPDIIRQYKVEWCKNPTTKKFFPFDICIESLKIIIELDGPQHFRQISNWTSPEQCLSRDVYKMKMAIDNGFTIIRLLQEDVSNDLFLWKNKLSSLLFKRAIPEICYICENNEYAQHILEFEILINNNSKEKIIDDEIDEDEPENCDDNLQEIIITEYTKDYCFEIIEEDETVENNIGDENENFDFDSGGIDF